MKLAISANVYQLQLKNPFTISRYTVSVQKTVIVTIGNGEHIGYGEATANPYYESTIDKIQASVNLVKPIIEDSMGLHPSEFWERLEPHLQDDYFALCALDCAYWDFYARTKQQTLRSFWSKANSNLPLTNYTIGIDSIEKMVSKIIETPWPCYKIKLGTEDDVKVITEIRKVTDAILRVDINCAWTLEEAIKNSLKLKSLNVEFIEQPLKSKNIAGMKLLNKESALPIIADESCQRLEDVELCAEYFQGINVKLMKCGGITPALKMIKKGRELGLQVMAGCMTESTVGISNLAQLAPLLDAIDADGAMLLERDIAKGVSFNFGTIIFSNGLGSGAELISGNPLI